MNEKHEPNARLGQIAIDELELIRTTIRNEVASEVTSCNDLITNESLLEQHHRKLKALEESVEIIKEYTS
jgi:hypothetical protein